MCRESRAPHPNPLPFGARATGYALQATRLSSRASRDSGETRDPSTPASEKGTTGVFGSRLSLRSAGMTTEETAPYATGLMLKGKGSTPEYATDRVLQSDLAEVDAGAELSGDCFATAA